MIIGFDVCHDSQRKNISFGALVATMNDAHTSYYSCVEPHESGEELSVHFATGITSKYLENFAMCVFYYLISKLIPIFHISLNINYYVHKNA